MSSVEITGAAAGVELRALGAFGGVTLRFAGFFGGRTGAAAPVDAAGANIGVAGFGAGAMTLPAAGLTGVAATEFGTVTPLVLLSGASAALRDDLAAAAPASVFLIFAMIVKQ